MTSEKPAPNAQPKQDFQPDEEHHGDKQSLAVHAIVLQLKLIADGLRDAMLIPVSLVAAVGGLLFRSEDPWLWYREVLLWGRASDHWVDLFDSYREQPDPDFDALLQATRTRLDNDPEHGKANGARDQHRANDPTNNNTGNHTRDDTREDARDNASDQARGQNK